MNIFLVEDEYWALAELVDLFRVYESKHKVYPFDNGEDALLAAETVHPHLVVTDINMPGMDGLGLAERLNQKDASIKKIIVSVHDQFEYARQGMKFGVADFLVKPVKKEVLYKAVDHMLEQLMQESKYTEEWLHGSMVQMLLSPDHDEHPKLQQFCSEACHMVLLQLDEGVEGRNWKETKLDIGRFITTLAGDTCAQIHGLELNGQQRVFLIADNREWEAYVHKHVADLIEQIRPLGHHVHMAITKKPGYHSLFETFSRLNQQLKDERLFGMMSVVLSKERKKEADLTGAWDRVRVLETLYKKGELAKGKTGLQGLLQELRHNQISKRQLALFVSDMLFSLRFNKYGTRNVSVHDLYEEPGMLDHISSYDELLVCLHDKIVSLYGEEDSKETNPKGLIPVLLKLIHHQYQSSISLQQFAAEHHVSIGYLSRMFKTQTGLTFSEYVTEYRIRKAQELLSKGIERLHEVSRLVGYEDPKHFSALFKKQVGESPMAYAKKRADKN